MHPFCRARVIAVALTAFVVALARCGEHALPISSNDVVAWVGGSDVASARDSAHLETILSVAYPGAKFRNFGWEGDTVFAQPRDVNFLGVPEQLKRAGATILLLQFGRAESLSGTESPDGFRAACETLANRCAAIGARVVLVTPAPFESGGGMLPDLTPRNAALAKRAAALRSLAAARHWEFLDPFATLTSHRGSHLTSDGLNLTPAGQALFARALAEALGCGSTSRRAGETSADGRWANPDFEKLRQLVIEKDRLWFNYWRPQNWAFLGGDRVTQPSSRDHRDPSIRWFPAEMERYVPLIRDKERAIELAAQMLRTP